MYAGRRRPETVSRKKRSVFLLMEKCFFLTYFLIGASGGLKAGKIALYVNVSRIEQPPSEDFRHAT